MTNNLPVGTRVVLTQDNRNPVTFFVHMVAGTLGTVVGEARGVDEDPSSEVIIHWDGASRPVRTMRYAVTIAANTYPDIPVEVKFTRPANEAV